MLEQDRVAPQRRVEDADVQQPLDGHQRDGDGQHRRAQHHGSGWSRTCAQTNSGSRNQVIPGARILWIVTMKFSPVRIDEKPVMNTAIAAGTTIVLENIVRERRVERPAGVDPAEDQDDQSAIEPPIM